MPQQFWILTVIEKTVRLKLEGSVRSKQVNVLRDFLETIVDIPGKSLDLAFRGGG
jgi:hypothetical protein